MLATGVESAGRAGLKGLPPVLRLWWVFLLANICLSFCACPVPSLEQKIRVTVTVFVLHLQFIIFCVAFLEMKTHLPELPFDI